MQPTPTHPRRNSPPNPGAPLQLGPSFPREPPDTRAAFKKVGGECIWGQARKLLNTTPLPQRSRRRATCHLSRRIAGFLASAPPPSPSPRTTATPTQAWSSCPPRAPWHSTPPGAPRVGPARLHPGRATPAPPRTGAGRGPVRATRPGDRRRTPHRPGLPRTGQGRPNDHHQTPPFVGSPRVTEPRDGVVEMCLMVHCGERDHVLAIRLERRGVQWVCTDFETA